MSFNLFVSSLYTPQKLSVICCLCSALDPCKGVVCGLHAHCVGALGSVDSLCVCNTGYSGDPHTECTCKLSCLLVFSFIDYWQYWWVLRRFFHFMLTLSCDNNCYHQHMCPVDVDVAIVCWTTLMCFCCLLSHVVFASYCISFFSTFDLVMECISPLLVYGLYEGDRARVQT